MTTRRKFIKQAGIASVSLGIGVNHMSFPAAKKEEVFKISLAEWSLHSPLFAKEIDHLDFPILAKKHGIDAVEYVNQFFMDKATDMTYLKEMKSRCDGEGVSSVLIMCDSEGMLGASDKTEREKSVTNHKKWVEAAKFLGCHSIRVNGFSDIAWSEDPDKAREASNLVSDGIRQLCEFADSYGIHVVIENHGGFSSNGKWLAETIRKADHHLAGTLPDFGNFQIAEVDGKRISYDSYRGVDELMPLATGVSMKPTVWNDHGREAELDYGRMMKIVLSHGYRGYVGIEHGEKDREWQSISEIKSKLEDVRKTLSSK